MEHPPKKLEIPYVIDSDSKEWIDARTGWILNEFGRHRVQSCPVILPTTEYFPGSFEKTEEAARGMLDQLSRYLDVDPREVELVFFREDNRFEVAATAAGYYEQQEQGRYRIWIEESQFERPLDMAATMCHELCHVLLLGHGRVSEETDDHEPLTDLLTVFLGLGVIQANAALRDSSWRSGNVYSWSVARCGYLSMTMYGYALALFALVRGEHSPQWVRHLRADVRDAYNRSLKHFSLHGQPDLSRVGTTGSRPVLAQLTPTLDDAEYATQLDPKDGTRICQYCGVILETDNDEEEDVCTECRESIEENTRALEEERPVEARQSHSREFGFRWFVVLIFSFVLLVVLLDWLKILP